jgi:hypothetical protein
MPQVVEPKGEVLSSNPSAGEKKTRKKKKTNLLWAETWLCSLVFP